MISDCTGVILSGGKNTRLPGKKKTFQRVGNEMILESIHNVFSKLFSEVIIVVNDPEDFASLDMTLVTDIYPCGCALAGIHAGLFYASSPNVFVTACDTPFLNPLVIEYIVSKIHPMYEVVMPRTPGGVEPLSAAYSKKSLPRIERHLKENKFKIKKVFKGKKIREIPIQQLQKIDPDMNFAFNVNTQKDLETANQIAGHIKNKD